MTFTCKCHVTFTWHLLVLHDADASYIANIMIDMIIKKVEYSQWLLTMGKCNFYGITFFILKTLGHMLGSKSRCCPKILLLSQYCPVFPSMSEESFATWDCMRLASIQRLGNTCK